MEQGQVVLCLFIYFIYFIHSFFLSILIKFYHVLIFCLFKRVKLIDYQSVNRSDFKAGSGPDVSQGEIVPSRGYL